MRASREASGADISIPSKPRIRSWPTGWLALDGLVRVIGDYAECLFYLLLQLCQQIQRFEGRKPVEVHPAQPLDDWLRQSCKDSQLRRPVTLHRPRLKMRAQLRLAVLVFGQYLTRPPHHFLGQAGEFRDLDSITAIGGPGLHFSE